MMVERRVKVGEQDVVGQELSIQEIQKFRTQFVGSDVVCYLGMEFLVEGVVMVVVFGRSQICIEIGFYEQLLFLGRRKGYIL